MSLFHDGPVVADASVPATSWTAAFCGRSPLVLAPGSAEGWFGGMALVACDPVLEPLPRALPSTAYDPSPCTAAAGRVLQRSLTSLRPCLSAALLPYDGVGMAATFRRGLALSPRGWHAWGDWRGLAVPRPAPVSVPEGSVALLDAPVSSLGPREFRRAVEAARAAMGEGDIYVVNLCRLLTGRRAVPAPEAFAALVCRTGATMGAFWQLPGRTVMSASPERFLRLQRGIVTVHPVKGTRPRGACAREDERLARGLAECAKEHAEHAMIVDLERNDLGRVCEPGTVTVAPMMRRETTRYCHQLVSAVGGVVRADTTLGDVLSATFPCGSVTGAPKRSAVAHIGMLERGGRAEYTGSLLVAVPGRLDSSVLIRTAVAAGDRMAYGVGCGVTVDSDPSAEWEETETKALPVLGIAR